MEAYTTNGVYNRFDLKLILIKILVLKTTKRICRIYMKRKRKTEANNKRSKFRRENKYPKHGLS